MHVRIRTNKNASQKNALTNATLSQTKHTYRMPLSSENPQEYAMYDISHTNSRTSMTLEPKQTKLLNKWRQNLSFSNHSKSLFFTLIYGPLFCTNPPLHYLMQSPPPEVPVHLMKSPQCNISNIAAANQQSFFTRSHSYFYIWIHWSYPSYDNFINNVNFNRLLFSKNGII